MRRPPILLALAVAACATPAPCHHTLEHVELYWGTVDGPAELAAIVRDPDEPLEVRVAAARTLVTLDRRDHDVQALLVESVREAAAPAIERAIAQRVTEVLREDPNVNGDPERVQVTAKDHAVALAPHLGADARAQVGEAVLAWHARDLARRRDLGRVGVEEAFAVFGDDRSRLLDALGPRSGPTALGVAVELLADGPLRSRAATRLLETETALRGESFEAWLRERLREEAYARGTRDLPPASFDDAVELNRRNFLEGVLVGMRRLCDEPAVADRLLAIGVEGTDDHLRSRALMALEGCAEARHVEPLITLAFDPDVVASVRDYAFDRLSELDDPRIAERLWRELPTAGRGPLGWRERWRVGALLVSRLAADAAPRFLAALPEDGEYAREELTLYAERLAALGAAARPALRDALGSDRWFVRVIALLALPVAEGAALRDDEAPLTGAHWGEWRTVGDVARREATDDAD